MTTHAFLGGIAGILALVPCLFYIRGILKGDTKPDRVTWWILALVSGMIAVSYHGVGAEETVWLPVAYTISFLTVAIFSLKYGDGPTNLHLLDRISLIGALVSAVVWLLSKSPLLGLVLNMLTESIGLAPTAYKAYLRPSTEDRTAWVITTTASIFNLLAVSEWSFAIAGYPIYIFTTNAVITYFILRPHLL